MALDSGNMRFMRIFPRSGGIKRQWDNRKRRFSGLSDATSPVTLRNEANIIIQYYLVLVAFPMTPKIHDLNDLELPFYVKFSLLRTVLSQFILHTCCRAYLQNIFLVSRDQQRCAEADRDPQNIWNSRKQRIFRRHYIVGILTNKANISIQYYFVSYCLSTDSKTRDVEWPRMAILR